MFRNVHYQKSSKIQIRFENVHVAKVDFIPELCKNEIAFYYLT